MSLEQRLEDRSAPIAVLGQGYVGLPLAVAFAQSGFSVIGIDSAAARVAALSRGQSYIPDVPDGDLQAVLDAGRFRATTDTDVSGTRMRS
jgi:UDP-N-acetyl-D-glucosamine dehydrogenase